MTNPAIIQTNTTTVDVTTANEITMAAETEWTPEAVDQLFGKMGRYFSRFHTVQQQQQETTEEQPD